MTKLEELKAAYEAATPGVWTAPGFNSQGGQVACLLDNPDGLRLVSGNFKRPDAKFIALAHNLMPQLLKAVNHLAECKELLREYPWDYQECKRILGGTEMTTIERMQNAYLNAVVFTEGEQPPADAEFSTLAKAQAYAECINLFWANEDIINETNCEQAAHDLWLTRNRHGSGFWDAPFGVYGGKANNEILTRCAHSMGSRWVEQGDDGLLYFTT